MSHLLAMIDRNQAEDLRKVAESSDSFAVRVTAEALADNLEKRALDLSSLNGGLKVPDNPLLGSLADYMKQHPPANIDALRDLLGQVLERDLQRALATIETSDEADPMGAAVKNVRRMAEILKARVDIAKYQKELQQYQNEMASQMGMAPNAAVQAAPMAMPGAAPVPPPGAPVPPPGPEAAPPGAPPAGGLPVPPPAGGEGGVPESPMAAV